MGVMILFFKSLKFVAALTVGLSTAAANAATYTYNLNDHPGTALAATYDYGLRLDYAGKFFSFGNGASAQLIYDDVAMTASIVGTMVESLGNGAFGSAWNISYSLAGMTDLGGGFFRDTSGSGSGTISLGSDVLNLGAKSNNWGAYFVLNADGNRLPNDNTSITGRGWVDPQSGLGGANDFLFTASLDDSGAGASVPRPAAGWMLLSGLLGLGAAARRRRS